jgi:hypothetical protein
MTTLCLDRAVEQTCGWNLHQWLGGDWALLFSNPQDFEIQGGRHGLEALRQEFGIRGVRGLAVKRDGPPESNWVDELHGSWQPVRLREPPFVAADEVSFATRALRGELLTLQCRFVLFIDGALKRRGVFKYSAGRHTGSPLELLACLDTLRLQPPIRRAA